MLNVIKDWFNRYFSDPEAIALLAILVVGFGVVVWLGGILLPVLISIVIAYILQWWIELLEKFKFPRTVAYLVAYIAFLTVFTLALFLLLPLLWRQCFNLISELPTMLQTTKTLLQDFFSARSDVISQQNLDTIASGVMTDLQSWGKQAVSMSLSSIPGVISWIVYLVLVPLLVFFFLKDSVQLKNWFTSFLPRDRKLLQRVWREMDEQMGNYIRGKLTEVTIVGVATYLVFFYFDLRYQVLLGSLVGLSVIIPYVGAVVVTIPVILVAYLQWGFTGGVTGDFAMLMYAYLVVQFIDGNILVPLLFSEAVNLHPVAIIVAILFFGAFWGFWGVFFAIPLATLIKAVINAWPRNAQPVIP